MQINTDKCKVLSLSRKNNSIVNYDYYFDDPSKGIIKLAREVCMKDLGILIDSELSFVNHIYDKINVARKMLGVIRRNFIDLDIDSFLLLYKSFVRSHLEFANSVWCPYRIGVIQDLEKVQKQATKLARGCKSLSYKERLVKLKLPTLKLRRARGDLIEVFKILHNIYDSAVVPVLDRNFDSRTRGQSTSFL